VNAARRALITDLLDAEFTAFMAALNAFPAERFGTVPRAGHPAAGHSAAWHALHVMDWTRATIQPGLNGPDTAHTFGHLGFEDRDWARAVTGPSLAHERDAQHTVLHALQTVLHTALSDLQAAPDERFGPTATFRMFGKTRHVVDSVTYHLRHTAYHRGQLALVLKELQ